MKGIIIIVKNDGIPISQSLKSIFETMVIIKNPTTINARPQSSGLGLYIASQFADCMNGKIGFIRHRDGSTFYVDLQASRQLSLL